MGDCYASTMIPFERPTTEAAPPRTSMCIQKEEKFKKNAPKNLVTTSQAGDAMDGHILCVVYLGNMAASFHRLWCIIVGGQGRNAGLDAATFFEANFSMFFFFFAFVLIGMVIVVRRLMKEYGE